MAPPAALTLICLFMVMQKSMMKYMTRMGQNTGTLNASKKVHTMATRMPFVAACLGPRTGVTTCVGVPAPASRAPLCPPRPPAWSAGLHPTCQLRRAPSAHQNLNSGSLRMKGRNSSFCLVGSEGPSSARHSRVRLPLTPRTQQGLSPSAVRLYLSPPGGTGPPWATGKL